MRDRLRAVECPSDVIDQIGGWLTQGVGTSYGEGYKVANINKWLIRISTKDAATVRYRMI
jgi:hypothetical protein